MVHEFIARKSIRINAPTTKVWEAITDREAIKKAFFGTEVITDWKKGSSIVYKGEWEGKKYEDKGKILDAEPGKVLRHTYWSSVSGREDKPENYNTVTYELKENGKETELTIIQDNAKDQKSVEHSEQNWGIILQSFKDYIEKGG